MMPVRQAIAKLITTTTVTRDVVVEIPDTLETVEEFGQIFIKDPASGKPWAELLSLETALRRGLLTLKAGAAVSE
jgi:hypothetical protein